MTANNIQDYQMFIDGPFRWDDSKKLIFMNSYVCRIPTLFALIPDRQAEFQEFDECDVLFAMFQRNSSLIKITRSWDFAYCCFFKPWHKTNLDSLNVIECNADEVGKSDPGSGEDPNEHLQGCPDHGVEYCQARKPAEVFETGMTLEEFTLAAQLLSQPFYDFEL